LGRWERWPVTVNGDKRHGQLKPAWQSTIASARSMVRIVEPCAGNEGFITLFPKQGVAMALRAKIEQDLLQILSVFAERLPGNDLKNVRELFVHNECGIGLEILCSQLNEYEVELTALEVDSLISFADELGVDISYLKR
jgi:hypothetical protein